ncbi:MAG: adenylate/guanylate cyclase domain-containing protein [Bacteroidales bacterium]|nr:adenylate/guanylate cyclase domain-containing protein [Bacteroidales bacterium]
MNTPGNRRIPRFYGLRIYLFASALYYFLVLPFLLILTIKYAPQLRQLGQKQAGQEVTRENRLDIPFPDSSGDKTAFETARRVSAEIARNYLQDTSSLAMDSLVTMMLDSIMENRRDTIGSGTMGSGDESLTVVLSQPSAGDAQDEHESPTGQAFRLLINLLLISFLAGFLFNIPYKRYFRKIRRRQPVSDKLRHFCSRYLLRLPWISSLILFLPFAIMHVFMLIKMGQQDRFRGDLEHTLFTQFFYVSFIASILAGLFVYFWEKHRVHIRYIDHIIPQEVLKRRVFGKRTGRIRNRLWISSAMTTLLPLTIVILYIFLSITYLRDIPDLNMNEDQKKILFGNYMMFEDVFSLNESEIPGWLFYFNSVNSLFMIMGIYSGIFIAFIYILFFVKWTTQDIVIPVNELLENMKKTGEGEISHFTVVRTNDEIGVLAEGYNEMTRRLGDYIHNISQMTEAYSRFVPRQFLDYLGKKSFVDIRLGDQVQKEMTVLFSDIRSFTEISEQMSPKENFDYLNYYLGYMEPVIRHNNGFIDKYIGDSIMALFSDQVEDALNAAIEMRIKLSQFNQVMEQFGKPSIRSGIGIHTGLLMLGVVGGEGRMDGTVISDAVNLAARLEGLTKTYGSSIIISQDTLIKLINPSQYNYRFLDIAKVKGKKEAVYVFEVIDGDPEDIRQLKIMTKDTYNSGINHFKNNRYQEALKCFREVSEINTFDRAAELYTERCMNIIRHGIIEERGIV